MEGGNEILLYLLLFKAVKMNGKFWDILHPSLDLK